MSALADGGRAKIGALLEHGGYSFVFAAPSAGRLVISWYHGLPHGKKSTSGNRDLRVPQKRHREDQNCPDG